MKKTIISTFLLSCLTLFTFAQTQIGADIDGEAAGDQSGYSVSISADGSRVAIGSLFNDGNGNNAGNVRVYEENGGTWVQVGSDIDGEAAGDLSGISVSITADGSRVAIGAKDNDGKGSFAGHVRVYEENGGTWVQIGSDIDGEAASDSFGTSVSISADGSRVAIGAPRNDGSGNNAGHVRVYEENGGAWVQVGSDIDGEAASDLSGISVSISADGSRVAIGAISNNGNGSNAGHARVYQENAGSWVQVGSDFDGDAPGDGLGLSVSISADGSRVAFGAFRNSSGSNKAGQVRVYEESAGTWVQVGPDIYGEAENDSSGNSVSISANGSRVAIGAANNSGNGIRAGHTRVYEESGGIWTQVGLDIDGEAAGDNSGRSVSISADGSKIAIGADSNYGNGNSAGHARVYSLPSPPPPPSAIPTMGQWATIIFALLMLTIGTVVLQQRELVLAGSQNAAFSFRHLPFDKKSFARWLLIIGGGLSIVFSIAILFFGYEMTDADVPGSLLAMPLAAYLFHLTFTREQ